MHSAKWAKIYMKVSPFNYGYNLIAMPPHLCKYPFIIAANNCVRCI